MATAKKPAPAFRRLDVDVRRAQLLEAGAQLFTEQGYDGVSMNDVARAAGISKGLLYHYFPGKQEFFVATLEAAAQELAALTETDPSAPPLEQLARALDGYLEWIDEHSESYVRLLESAGSLTEVATVIARIRDETANRIMSGLLGDADPPPALRLAVHGWLGFMDGACLQWLERREPSREKLRDLLLGALAGAIVAARGVDPRVPALG